MRTSGPPFGSPARTWAKSVTFAPSSTVRTSNTAWAHPMVVTGGALQEDFPIRRRNSSASTVSGKLWPRERVLSSIPVDLDQPAEEVRRLERCLNDLVGIMALPARNDGPGVTFALASRRPIPRCDSPVSRPVAF